MKLLIVMVVAMLATAMTGCAWPPAAATQTEVNAGTDSHKYVTPATLFSWTGGASGGITAAQATTIAQGVLSAAQITLPQLPSPVVTNGAVSAALGSLEITNYSGLSLNIASTRSASVVGTVASVDYQGNIFGASVLSPLFNFTNTSSGTPLPFATLTLDSQGWLVWVPGGSGQSYTMVYSPEEPQPTSGYAVWTSSGLDVAPVPVSWAQNAATQLAVTFNGAIQTFTLPATTTVQFTGFSGSSGSVSFRMSGGTGVTYPGSVKWVTAHPTAVASGIVSFTAYGSEVIGAYKETQ